MALIDYFVSVDGKNQIDPGPDPVTKKPRPIRMRTSTFTREEKEPKGCFRDAGSWNHPLGKKKICLINRYDYKHSLKEPVYPCALDEAAKYKQKEYTGDSLFTQAGCRPDFRNGTKGMLSVKNMSV